MCASSVESKEYCMPSNIIALFPLRLTIYFGFTTNHHQSNPYKNVKI